MFGVDFVQPAIDFVAQYGLFAVFLLLVLDAAMLLPGLPGEVIMIMAVSRFVDTRTELVELVLLTTLAAVVGSLALYGVARAGGRRLVERHPRLFMMDRRRREKLERSFQRPSGKVLVLVLRFVPLTRVLVTIPAGVARMRFVPFLLLTTIGMLIFHAGFLWLAYEYNQPESGVAQGAESLQAAYATPAWEYVQTNHVVAALGVLAFGAILSMRSSAKLLRDPEASTSLIGWLSTRLLFLGGIALGVALWLAPDLVIEGAAAQGSDVEAFAEVIGSETIPMLAFFASVAGSIGFILVMLEGSAKRRRARWRRRHEAEKKRHEGEERREARLAQTPPHPDLDDVIGPTR